MVLNFQYFLRLLDTSYLHAHRSWTKSESSNSETSYEYVTSEYLGSESRYDGKITAGSDKRSDQGSRMETIPEEYEPKVSVKEILARFENLRDEKHRSKDKNNNKCINVENKAVVIKEHKKTANKDHKLVVEKPIQAKTQKQESKVYSSTTSVLELVTQSADQTQKITKDSSEKDVSVISGSSSGSVSILDSSSASSSVSSGDSGTGSAKMEVMYFYFINVN